MIQTSDSSRIYNGNNSTTTPYPVPFYFFHDEDLFVVFTTGGIETTADLGTDYTVTGAQNPNGGSIRTTAPVPATTTVSIARSVPATQLTSYEEADAFPAKSHEAALDKLTMLIQQALRVTGSGGATDLGHAFRLTQASPGINAAARVNDSSLGLDAFGNAILRTSGEMLGWLGEGGTAWANTAERLVKVGTFPGQVGVQLDNMTIYIAHSTTPGDWFPFLIGSGIIGATNGVPHLITPPAGDLVGTDASQTLHNKTLISPAIIAPTGLDKDDVGLSQVDNTSDVNKPLSTATATALAFKQDKSAKGAPNGYADLDGGGKVPLSEIPDSLLGASQYQGAWNAATNTPTIPVAALGNKGWYYVVSVAGTTNINGISSWAVGDQIISNGTVWEKIPNVSAVSSVNGKTGTVVVNKSDVGLANVDNTSDAQKNAAAVALTNHIIDGTNNTLNVRLGTTDVSGNLPTNKLNGGTGADVTTFWRGDGSWARPVGTGDVIGPSGSVDGEVALYDGTSGKIIRRYNGVAGFGKFSSTGVFSTSPLIHAADLSPDVISGQPAKTTVGYNDLFVLFDQSTGFLKSVSGAVATRLPRNHLSGLGVANNINDAANDIDIAPGECRDGTNVADMSIATTLTKRIDALWAPGNDQGGRDLGADATATWHLFVIHNPSTQTTDALFSQSFTNPTLPSGYTLFRRIASLRRTGGNFRAFRLIEDYFQWLDPTIDADGATVSAVGQSVLQVIWAPAGRKFLTHMNVRAKGASSNIIAEFMDPDQSYGGVGNVTSPSANFNGACNALVWTNASSQVKIYHAGGSGSLQYYISTLGYYDHRGKDN